MITCLISYKYVVIFCCPKFLSSSAHEIETRRATQGSFAVDRSASQYHHCHMGPQEVTSQRLTRPRESSNVRPLPATTKRSDSWDCPGPTSSADCCRTPTDGCPTGNPQQYTKELGQGWATIIKRSDMQQSRRYSPAPAIMTAAHYERSLETMHLDLYLSAQSKLDYILCH
jgi:hypothetical protein